jgi:hypothetical protein
MGAPALPRAAAVLGGIGEMREGSLPDVPQTPTSPYGQQVESLPVAVRSELWTTLLNLWTTLLKLWTRRSSLDYDMRLPLRRTTRSS